MIENLSMDKQVDSHRLSFIKLLPNILTIISLCCGMTAIKYTLDSQWENAVLAIIIAACFDALDGATARLLKATSRFGAELDSLADSVNFGIVPSITFYIWLKESTSNEFDLYYLGWSWVACTLFLSCCILRLARFNILDKSLAKKNLNTDFFLGVPSPAGAGLLLLPMVAKFVADRFDFEPQLNDSYFVVACSLWIVLVSVLMISTISTISFKKLRFKIHKKRAMFILLFVMLLIAILLKEFWVTVLIIQSLYLLSIPLFSIFAGAKS